MRRLTGDCARGSIVYRDGSEASTSFSHLTHLLPGDAGVLISGAKSPGLAGRQVIGTGVAAGAVSEEGS